MASTAPKRPAESREQEDAGQRRETSAPPETSDNHLPDADLLELADRCVEDEGIMQLLLAQPSLPPSILLVLAERLPAAAFDELIKRHGLPDSYRDELAKRSRTRPPWWRAHMASMMR